MEILNRKTYVKFLALCPLNGWALTFILIVGGGHTVVHTSFKDASLLNVFLFPFLLGWMTIALPLLIAKLSALNPVCQSEWLAPGKTPDPVMAHPWVRLGQLDSPFHKCEWKAQKEGPVGGGHGSWEVLGDWGNRNKMNEHILSSKWPWFTKAFGFLVPRSYDCPHNPMTFLLPFQQPLSSLD